MRLFDRLGVRHLFADDAEPAAFCNEAGNIIYFAEVRRSECVAVEACQSIDGCEREILALRADPYMGDFRPVSFRLSGRHYRPDENALSLIRVLLEAIRAGRVPDVQGLERQFPLTEPTGRIKLAFSRGEPPV